MVIVLAYIMATSFLNVFALTMQTILICFVEDRHNNKDTPALAYYPEELAKVVLSSAERKAQKLTYEVEKDKKKKEEAAKAVEAEEAAEKAKKGDDKKADKKKDDKSEETAVKPITL